MAHTNEKKDEGVPVGAIAAGVLAAGAAAAAGYYFYGAKSAPQHRKEAVKWAHDFKRDVVKEAKKLKSLGEEAMHVAIDRVVARVTDADGSIDQTALSELVKELKANWRKVRAEATSTSSPVKAKKASRRPAKKTTKKGA